MRCEVCSGTDYQHGDSNLGISMQYAATTKFLVIVIKVMLSYTWTFSTLISAPANSEYSFYQTYHFQTFTIKLITFETISDGDSLCKDKSDKSYCQQQVITPYPQNTDDGNIHPLLRSSLAASPTPAWVWRSWTAAPASVRWAGHTPCYICPRNNSAIKV